MIPAPSTPYKLILKVLSATLDRTTDMMGKMDPYCLINFYEKLGLETV